MFVATIPAVLYIDQFGRKPVLIAGAIGMGVSHIIVAALYGSFGKNWEAHSAAGWVAVVFVWIYEINFGYSWGVSLSIFPMAWTRLMFGWCSPGHGSSSRKYSLWVYVQRVFQLGLLRTG